MVAHVVSEPIQQGTHSGDWHREERGFIQLQNKWDPWFSARMLVTVWPVPEFGLGLAFIVTYSQVVKRRPTALTCAQPWMLPGSARKNLIMAKNPIGLGQFASTILKKRRKGKERKENKNIRHCSGLNGYNPKDRSPRNVSVQPYLEKGSLHM